MFSFVLIDGGILGIDHTQSCETAYLPLSVANDRHCSPVHTSMQRGCTDDLCLKVWSVDMTSWRGCMYSEGRSVLCHLVGILIAISYKRLLKNKKIKKEVGITIKVRKQG